MMTFSFSFDDYEEAEIGLAAFAETCRQLKTTLKRKPKPTTAPKQATALVGDGLVGNGPDDLLPPLPATPADPAPEATAPEAEAPAAPARTRKSTKKPDAKVEPKAEAKSEPKAEAKSEPKAEAQTLAVKTVTLEQLRDLGNEIIAKEGGKGAKKVGAVLKQFNGARQFPDVPEDKRGEAYAKLQAAALNDQIPF
jgi:hypothetical protein